MPRNQTIELIKIIAIILVVVGHLLARPDPNFPDALYNIKAAIYTFHMPLFMFVSGFAAKCHAQFAPPQSIATYVKTRFQRLIIPAILIIIFGLVAKSIAAQFLHVDNWNGELINSATAYLTHSESAPLIFVWYLFVLFYLNSLYRIVGFRFEAQLLLTFLLANIVMPITAPPEVLFLNRFILYGSFFFAGAIIAKHETRIFAVLTKTPKPRYLLVFAALGFCMAGLINASFGWPHAISLYVVGPTAIAFFIMGIFPFQNKVSAKWTGWLSGFTLTIYLFNVFFIGFTKALFYKFIPEASPVVVLTAMLATGYFGPILLGHLAQKFTPKLGKILR